MKRREELEKEVLKKLCQTISQNKLTVREIIHILVLFIYSLGAGIEKEPNISTEEVIKRYAKNPTIGVALMAQAYYMKETWLLSLIKESKEGNKDE